MDTAVYSTWCKILWACPLPQKQSSAKKCIDGHSFVIALPDTRGSSTSTSPTVDKAVNEAAIHCLVDKALSEAGIHCLTECLKECSQAAKVTRNISNMISNCI